MEEIPLAASNEPAHKRFSHIHLRLTNSHFVFRARWAGGLPPITSRGPPLRSPVEVQTVGCHQRRSFATFFDELRSGRARYEFATCHFVSRLQKLRLQFDRDFASSRSLAAQINGRDTGLPYFWPGSRTTLYVSNRGSASPMPPSITGSGVK